MRQTSKVKGTKIAQAAKDLNVTSVTIRRYLAEFNIETNADLSGIKVLPGAAIEELKEIRRLKEEGLTNPAVMEILEGHRKKRDSAGASEADTSQAVDDEATTDRKRPGKPLKLEPLSEAIEEAAQVESSPAPEQAEGEVAGAPREGVEGHRPKHTLTCQTCGKSFEHMNPRLRDCLDCYRTKRKERRRGGAEKHKNVIQHPIAQLVANKSAQQNGQAVTNGTTYVPGNGSSSPTPALAVSSPSFTPAHAPKFAVRNYRKAIEETRQITGSLKRRLERPDLPEGDRRWLEQIYAYQLILHQGWRHLSDYKNAGQQQEENI